MLTKIYRFRLHAFAMVLALLAGCQTAPPQGLNAQQIAVLKQQGFELTEQGWSFGLSGKVLFGNDVDTLNQQSRVIVERIATALLAVDIQHLRVDGHTDATGQAAYNESLSLRRAASVTKALINAGVPAQNIETRGLGSRYPVAGNDSAAGRTENRRVAIVVASN
ncbi:Peptidoglycan-binding protein ArfA [compost metagenome]